ncbi:MAG: hypothetical protein GPJ52_02610 [Candidatus Heimdallarchaeota archaeon]|nr:hypothetical protein [Candidatus Heimdallarchaeota archaeon]
MTGLLTQLRNGKISQKHQLELIDLLQNNMIDFDYYADGYTKGVPMYYHLLVKVLGKIGSEEAVPFLKKIISWVPYDWGTMSEGGEYYHDFTYEFRCDTILTLLQINKAKFLDFLYQRYQSDYSPSVRNTIIFELRKVDSKEARKYVQMIEEKAENDIYE